MPRTLVVFAGAAGQQAARGQVPACGRGRVRRSGLWPSARTITVYSLVFGSLLLLGGRAADLLGRRRMFLTGLGIFTATSFTSAMAGSAAALFAAGVGHGPGAAMLSPAALSLITSNFHVQARAKALAAWGAVGGAGAALGAQPALTPPAGEGRQAALR